MVQSLSGLRLYSASSLWPVLGSAALTRDAPAPLSRARGARRGSPQRRPPASGPRSAPLRSSAGPSAGPAPPRSRLILPEGAALVQREKHAARPTTGTSFGLRHGRRQGGARLGAAWRVGGQMPEVAFTSSPTWRSSAQGVDLQFVSRSNKGNAAWLLYV